MISKHSHDFLGLIQVTGKHHGFILILGKQLLPLVPTTCQFQFLSTFGVDDLLNFYAF